MTRNELLKSKAYWTQLIQLELFEMVNQYLAENDMTQVAFAEKLGKTKGYVSQILNGDFDHKVSKLVELALACDRVPSVSFAPADKAEAVVTKRWKPETSWTPVVYTQTQFSAETDSISLFSGFKPVKRNSHQNSAA